ALRRQGRRNACDLRRPERMASHSRQLPCIRPNHDSATEVRYVVTANSQAASTMQLACAEREDFFDLLTGLSREQWEQPSLCQIWRVGGVLAHVVSYDELGRWGLVRRFAKGWFVPECVNAVGVAEYATRSPEQLTELMRACIPPRGLTAGFGGMIALVDGMIHQQDIRRPLGIPRVIPPQPLRVVLNYALTAPATPRRQRP